MARVQGQAGVGGERVGSPHPFADIVEEAQRILAEAAMRSLPVRLLGGLAIRLHSSTEPHPRLARDLKDIDLVTVREKASADLERLGPGAYPALRKALQAPSLEVRRRAARLLEKKGGPPPPPTLSTEELRALRAVEVLEWIATEEAREILSELARGAAGAPQTSAAVAALRRLTPAPRNPD